MENRLPSWASDMAEIFKSGSISQFLLYGNTDDWVTYRDEDNNLKRLALRDFLSNVMFAPFEVVIAYDRGHGIRSLKGSDLFYAFLKTHDAYHQTNFAALTNHLDSENALPKEPRKAMAIIDRFIRNGLIRSTTNSNGVLVSNPMRIAVIIEYAQYLLPRAEVAYTSSETIETLIRIQDWASDPNINSAFISTCLIAENLNDVNIKI